MPQTPWPKRFRDDAGAASASSAHLASLFDACTEAADPADDVIRQAVRVALRSQPSELGLRSKLQDFARASWNTCTRYSRRALVAAALFALLQLGFAFAAELGWHPLRDVRLWPRAARTARAPLVQAPIGAQAPEQTAVPLPGAPTAESSWPAPIAALPPERAEPGRRKRSAGAMSAMPVRWKPLADRRADPRTDPLAEEAGMVSHAIALVGVNPRSSLASLAEYRRAFPGGALQGEAALAELRAHLALREPQVALASLDRLAADRFASAGGSAPELRTSRFELMAGAGRCPEALRTLDAEIASAPSPRLQGRLLFVRASCRSALGDALGSQRDLRQYLHVLPDGPRAAEIRRRLNAGD